MLECRQTDVRSSSSSSLLPSTLSSPSLSPPPEPSTSHQIDPPYCPHSSCCCHGPLYDPSNSSINLGGGFVCEICRDGSFAAPLLSAVALLQVPALDGDGILQSPGSRYAGFGGPLGKGGQPCRGSDQTSDSTRFFRQAPQGEAVQHKQQAGVRAGCPCRFPNTPSR